MSIINQDPSDPNKFTINFRYSSMQLEHGAEAGKWMGVINLDDGHGHYFLREAYFDTQEEADAYAMAQGKALVAMRMEYLTNTVLKGMMHNDDN